MRRALWLLLPMTLALPLAARTQSVATARRPPAHAAVLAPSAMLPPGQHDYDVVARFHGAPPFVSGWGLFAVLHGRSMDLSSPGGWAAAPDARAQETEAGYGWRRSGLTAMVGYVQPDLGRPEGVPRGSPSGLVGLNITLRSR